MAELATRAYTLASGAKVTLTITVPEPWGQAWLSTVQIRSEGFNIDVPGAGANALSALAMALDLARLTMAAAFARSGLRWQHGDGAGIDFRWVDPEDAQT